MANFKGKLLKRDKFYLFKETGKPSSLHDCFLSKALGPPQCSWSMCPWMETPQRLIPRTHPGLTTSHHPTPEQTWVLWKNSHGISQNANESRAVYWKQHHLCLLCSFKQCCIPLCLIFLQHSRHLLTTEMLRTWILWAWGGEGEVGLLHLSVAYKPHCGNLLWSNLSSFFLP